MSIRKYFSELKRRNVVKSGIAYLIVAWLIAQVAALVLPTFGAPPYILKTLLFILGVGFILNLIFAWIYDITPEGIKRTESLKKEGEEYKSLKGNRLNLVIILSLLVAVIFLIFDNYIITEPESIAPIENLSLGEISKGEKSIAVVPFKNWSGDEKLEYVSDGMTDAVITRLAETNAISKVVPFTSMLPYKNSGKSIAKIAEEQHVSYVLEGNFQLSGDQLKISLKLIEGQSEEQVWSDTFAGSWNIQEIFDLQDRVTQKVLDALQLSNKEGELLKKQEIPTLNLDAYEAFLLAEHQRLKANQKAWGEAIPLYERAINLDPKFVAPYGGLAQIYVYRGLIWGLRDQHDSWSIAKELILQAREIDSTDNLLNGQLINGSLYFEWDFEGLQRNFNVELKTTDRSEEFVLDRYMDFLLKTGQYEDGLRALDWRIKQVPTQGSNYGKKAEALYLAERYKSCDSLLRRFDRIFLDDDFYVRESAKWHFYLGNAEESRNQLERLIADEKNLSPILLWLQAVHSYGEEESKERSKYLELLKEKYSNNTSGSPAWFIALYYCHTKDYDLAFEWLEKSFEFHEVEMIWLRAEPLWGPVRNDQRYLDIYNKMKYPVPPLDQKTALVDQPL